MNEAPATGLNFGALIDDVVEGRWRDPATGKAADVPVERIVMAESLAGREAGLIEGLKLGPRLAVVSDENTRPVLGERVAEAAKLVAGEVDEVVLPGDIKADEATVAVVRARTRRCDGLIAVGSGVLSDVVKFAAFHDGKRYCVFGTAASMNGYTASTASITTDDGLKSSLPAKAPAGCFLDLRVSAEAPRYLTAAGLGDMLCRPTAQIDWWASHRLFGTSYFDVPYQLLGDGEAALLQAAPGLARGDVAAVGVLQGMLTLCGLGTCFTGVSNHGSMGEHSVSHWLDMFAGPAHPGSKHGQQVGVAAVSLMRLQERVLAEETPPRVAPTELDEARFSAMYGKLAPMCLAEARRKALDAAGAEAFNAKMAELWPELRAELRAMALPSEALERALREADGPVTGAELGLPREVWRDALLFGGEIRSRWSFLDLAAGMGILRDFAEEEAAR